MDANTERQPDDGPAKASDARLRRFIGYNMKRAYMQVQDDVAETLAPFGLRIGTFSALAVVIESPGISQSQLSQVLNIKRSGVVVVVDELEGAGVLERARVEGDRRAYSLRVTPEGERLWQRAERAVREHERAFFSNLGEDGARELNDLLARAAESAASRREGKAT
jgi:DNA-binding MarR family transcriptional regulator